MNQEPEYIQHITQKNSELTMQEYFNMLLEQLSEGKVHTSADLLRLIKRRWKLVAVDQFPDVYQYVITLPVIMDECLKMLPGFSFQQKDFRCKAGDAVVTGYRTDGEEVEAWMFFHGTNEQKQYLLHRAVQMLEQQYPEQYWTLTALDPAAGERFCRKKYGL
ncbi:hypothetical protein [Salibacterium sp. K-3]